MIQFLADNIDQLDLALDQLAIRDRNFDRFALMLIDNVVELTLHKYAQDKAAENKLNGPYIEPKFDPSLISKALGRFFDDKAKLARDFGLIDDRHCTTLLHLHRYRNTVYHQGLRHEGILHSLAIFYFMNACDLLTAYEPIIWGSSRDVYSHRALKYIGQMKMFANHETFKNAYARLREVVDSLDFDLLESLSLDMEITIEHIDEMIDFLATDSPEQCIRDDVIVKVQASSIAFTETGKRFARDNGCTVKYVGAYLEWLAKNYNWPIKTDPINSWRGKLTRLRQQSDCHIVLERFCNFMNETSEIRSQINEAASTLDIHIQQEIDRARGK